jgi:hypothetical protein
VVPFPARRHLILYPVMTPFCDSFGGGSQRTKTQDKICKIRHIYPEFPEIVSESHKIASVLTE